MEAEAKPVRWVASSRNDLRGFPKDVRRSIGQALYAAQHGEQYPSVKALKGFGGRSVLEIIEDYRGDTYRAVYTVKFRGAIYVLQHSRRSQRRASPHPRGTST